MHKLFTSKYLCFNTALGTMTGTVIEIYTGHHSVVSDFLQPHGLYWVNSLSQNTRVGTFPFSRASSQPRGRTQVSHIAGRFFTS